MNEVVRKVIFGFVQFFVTWYREGNWCSPMCGNCTKESFFCLLSTELIYSRFSCLPDLVIIYFCENLKTIIMKNIFAIVLLLIAQFSNAQRYDLTQSNLPFTPLTNATTLELPQDWDDDQALIVLPFTYSFYGSAPSDSIFVQTNAAFTNLDFNVKSLPGNTIILFGGSYDLVQKPATTVKYKIEGVAPNRKFTVEYLNAGFYGEAPDSGNINIQNSVSEDGCFSIHLGSASLPSSSTAFTDGLLGIYSIGKDSICYGTAEGDVLNYAEGLGDASLNSGDAFLTDYPGENKFFEFCPRNTTSTKKIVEQLFSVFPNPSMDRIQLLGLKNNSLLVFYDITGKIALQVNKVQASEQVDISELKAGMYLLKSVASDGSIETLKFIKK